ENLTYLQLLERCVRDPDTGLYMLQIVKTSQRYVDEATRKALDAEWVDIKVGRYRGQRWSVWKLLNSEYMTEEKKQELVAKYKKETSHALEKVVKVILELITEKERSTKQLWFQGIRRQITPSELFNSHIITKDTLEALEKGQSSVEEIQKQAAVKRYLEGTSCIAGVLAPCRDEPSHQEKMSIYQAMWKGVLRPGTALVLLEAQAATGFIIDPVGNRRLSVEEAVAEGVVGGEVREKLLSAERAVTGYTDPYTGEQISLFQAMQKDLIVRDHGVRLLEAQIATGGVIDPVHSHRVPVEVAYQRGYFDEDMNRVLADPGDDTKGFFDPNTHENLTYLQLLGRCVRDPDTGLYMLQLAGLSRVSFRGLRRQVSASELRTAKILDPETLRDLAQGTKTLQEVTEMDAVKRYLEGTSCIAGVLAPCRDEPSRQEKMSIYQAMWKGVLRPGTALVLLEAQAATGFIIDPVGNRRLSVEEAVAEGVVGGEVREKLLSAERAVTGYTDPYTGEQISLFQAMQKDLIVRDHGVRLLEAQIATGGVIDPVHSHRVPVEVAYQRGYFDEDMNRVLADPGDDTKGFFDPNTHENLTYLQLLGRCVRDPDTGLYMLQLAGPGAAVHQLGEELRAALRGARVTPDEPSRQEKMSIYQAMWKGVLRPGTALVLLESEAMWKGVLRPGTALVLLEAQAATGFIIDPVGNRRLSVEEAVAEGVVGGEAMQKYRAGTLTVQEVGASLTALLDGDRADGERGGSQKDPRGALRAATMEEVTEMDAVKRYLEGTSCIAGVLAPCRDEPSRQEKMSIYQAMWKGVLRPGTALVLLEAQAATGFIIDPVGNRRLSVEEAVAEGVVGGEVREKLLSAERAVTGYTDPYTGEQISLFQAMQKDLIVRDHGVRLLEAQIATGGVIDPVHSHRVPVEVAYQRGYFDEDMNRVLADPGDDTKGFFDPNTHENLTYLQLLGRCVRDPDTGLLFLSVSGE
uniref:Epiplakin 1 n=1 Tax=Loxodonta africana TaxID=9785 RepID=G3TNL7_LOXAF